MKLLFSVFFFILVVLPPATVNRCWFTDWIDVNVNKISYLLDQRFSMFFYP